MRTAPPPTPAECDATYVAVTRITVNVMAASRPLPVRPPVLEVCQAPGCGCLCLAWEHCPACQVRRAR